MGEYKTKIIISLNGNGILYFVKEDLGLIQNIIHNINLGYEQVIRFNNALDNQDNVIKLLTINPANCSSVEFHELK